MYMIFFLFLGEFIQVDYFIFVVYGIGDFCDVRFRNIIECGENNIRLLIMFYLNLVFFKFGGNLYIYYIFRYIDLINNIGFFFQWTILDLFFFFCLIFILRRTWIRNVLVVWNLFLFSGIQFCTERVSGQISMLIFFFIYLYIYLYVFSM